MFDLDETPELDVELDMGAVDELDSPEDLLDTEPPERLAPALGDIPLTERLNTAVDNATRFQKKQPLQALLQLYGGLHAYKTGTPREQQLEVNRFLLAWIYRIMAPIADTVPGHGHGREYLGRANTLLEALFRETGDEKFRDLAQHLEEEYEASEYRLGEAQAERSTYQSRFASLGKFDILVNDAEDVMFGIPRPPVDGGEPATPFFYYDGGDHAILFRDEKSPFLCDFINPGARPAILASSRILIAELENGAFVKDYLADMVLLEELGWLLELLGFQEEQ